MTTKSVKVAALKARLSEHLRAVRRGARITVLDRDTPIAQIVPVETSGDPLPRQAPEPGARAWKDLPRPAPLGRYIDVVALLREDRDRR